MGMSKYKIKETGDGKFIVYKLKDMGNGFCFVPTMGRYTSKEAAEAYVEAERKAEHEK